MGVIGILLLVVFVIASLLLIFLVVIQDEDSDSIGGIFAGGSGSAFGSRSSNVVIKITYVLGGVFFVAAFALAIMNKSSVGNVEAVVATEQVTTQTEWWKPASPDSPAPTGEAGATTEPAAKDAAPATGN